MPEERTYCKVIIIDDEYIMRQGIKHMIEWEKEGFKIVGEAANGEEGLNMVEKLEPNIVLADIVMPVINGMEFTSIIKKRFPQVRVIILSSYDRFEYVKETIRCGAIDYILKPSLNPEKLIEVLNKTVSTIPNLRLKKDRELSIQEQLTRYLSGYDAGLSEAAFNQTFPHSQFRLLCSDQGTLCNGYRELENDVYTILQTFFALKNNYIVKVIRIKEEICCILINYCVKDSELLCSDIKSCIDKISIYQTNTFWVLGNAFRSHKEILESFNSVVDKLGFRFYHEVGPLIDENDCCSTGREKRFDYEMYSSYIKYREFNIALKMLEQYINESCELYMDEYMLKNIAKNMIYSFIVEFEKVDNSIDCRKTIFFRKIDASTYKSEFLKVFHEIIEELNEQSQEFNGGENGNISEICKYIRNHYSEELELTQLSKQFGYNYNYLSTYFNQEVKEGFSGYLNNLRIDKACEMLKTTQKSIADISSAVGYSDHSYFCRVFKNLKGRTPSEWRRTDVN